MPGDEQLMHGLDLFTASDINATASALRTMGAAIQGVASSSGTLVPNLSPATSQIKNLLGYAVQLNDQLTQLGQQHAKPTITGTNFAAGQWGNQGGTVQSNQNISEAIGGMTATLQRSLGSVKTSIDSMATKLSETMANALSGATPSTAPQSESTHHVSATPTVVGAPGSLGEGAVAEPGGSGGGGNSSIVGMLGGTGGTGGNQVSEAIVGVEASINSMTTKLSQTMTDVFGGGMPNITGTPQPEGMPNIGATPNIAGAPAGSLGEGGSVVEPSEGGGSGGGSSILGALGETGGNALSAAGLAAIMAGGVVANTATSAASGSNGMDWTTLLQQLAPFSSVSPNKQNNLENIFQNLIGNNPGFTGNNPNIMYNSVSGLQQAMQSLIGYRGAQPGTSAYNNYLGQASTLATVMGQPGNIGMGAAMTSSLGTAGMLNYQFMMGLNPQSQQNSNVIGIAESLAERLNNGTFPNQQQLQAMIGPGQPLDVTLLQLAAAMGVSDPQSFVSSIESVLLREAESVNNGQFTNLGMAQSPAQQMAAEKALGYNPNSPNIKEARATSELLTKGASAALSNARAQAAVHKTVANAVPNSNDTNSILGQIYRVLGTINGVLGGAFGKDGLAMAEDGLIFALSKGLGAKLLGWFGSILHPTPTVPESTGGGAGGGGGGEEPVPAASPSGEEPVAAEPSLETLGFWGSAGILANVGDPLPTVPLKDEQKLAESMLKVPKMMTKQQAEAVNAFAQYLEGKQTQAQHKNLWEDIFGGGPKYKGPNLKSVQSELEGAGISVTIHKGAIVINSTGNAATDPKLPEKIGQHVAKETARQANRKR